MIGCIIMAVWADNHGRKNTLILSGIAMFIGSVILIFSIDLWMAVIGLLLCGIGSDAALTLFSSIGAEWYEDNYRQKVGSIVQTAYIVGALAVTLFYYLFEDWKITTLYCLIIPSFINAVIIILFVKESPMYLIIANP
jgi:MFS family permease